ncbi:primosomal protein N' (replication factor Y) [Friedmanniella endophytica]|uniref:Probable replication restart protein PriA n=1 Tax=Microlunatus kandeliicorticis TaxID=1759536 RepID=A0A7W3ITU1_9ACTN|nr:primosomal protein N' [Microlunatus kandeliicorticis]MBA8795078.1 primosomal protein N' (replication factor Y) [Microlunatus kandeliicorticis]
MTGTRATTEALPGVVADASGPKQPARRVAPGEQTEQPAPAVAAERPVAEVAVDVSLSHLDRPFDYLVPADLAAQAVPGARVRVRFAGRLRDGFVLARKDAPEGERSLALLHKVVSPEPVLTPEVARLVRSVADHYAGCFADVVRLAVPPRHAATEKAARRAPMPGEPAAEDPDRDASAAAVPGEPSRPAPGPFAHYPTGAALLDALARGDRPRAAWQPVPAAGEPGDWALGFATAAAATAAGGRGSVLVVPDQRDLHRLAEACTAVLGADRFVTLTADLGPAARYRAFLAALRGDVAVVIGTRAAAFAPVRDLGLVAVWDDGDDLLAEPRAPYPHVREVLALRAAQQHAAAIFAGYARSCEVERLVATGWCRPLVADRADARRGGPRMRIAADAEHAPARDPAARVARLPHDVFTVIRDGLAAGPVLVQVPRTGYLLALACQDCRSPVRCPHCHGPTRADRSSADPAGGALLSCRWCGRLLPDWTCEVCGSQRWRAPVVGSTRTAEELGRAFPSVPVRQSAGGRVLDAVDDRPALVIATPGAEPAATTGYAAAVLLDAALPLLRTDLRAAEEAVRRWLNATALVRPGAAGGTVIAVGAPEARALQALLRLDPAGFAARELADRAEARFPPAVKLVAVDGARAALQSVVDDLTGGQTLDPGGPSGLPATTELLGPTELGPSDPVPAVPGAPGPAEGVHRLTLRAPLGDGARLVAAVKAVAATRSAKKAEGALRVQVDPAAFG